MSDRYIELVYNDFAARPGTIIKTTDFKPAKIDKVVYTSMFQYDDYILQYWEISKKKFGRSTVKEYDGDVYLPYLWIDIDDKRDLNNSVTMCRSVIEKLNFKYDLPYESMVIYFSGGKGFHIGIHSSIFGAQDYKSKVMKDIIRNMVTEIMDGKNTVDFSIYDTTRVWRAPFSKHNKNDNYKVDIDFNLIFDGNLEKILELSRECKREIPYKYSFALNKPLEALFGESIRKAEADKENVGVLLDKSALQENKSIFKIPQEGNRNFDLFRQAFRLFSIKELNNSEIIDIMKFVFYATNEIAAANKVEPVSEKEFRISMDSAFKRSRAAQKIGSSSTSVHKMIGEVVKTIVNARYISTLIKEFNDDLRGGLVVENLYALIGDKGTAKSIYCQETSVVAALDKIPSLYVNAEMSNVALLDRLYLRTFKESLIKVLQDKKANSPNGEISEHDVTVFIAEVEYKLHEVYQDYLNIVSEIDLDAKAISDIAKRTEDRIKMKIQLVVMDSMNSMKMHGDSEALTAFQNTKYLKQECKNNGYVGLLINHVTKGCDPTLRDCSEYVRGGSKVLQNCDAYYSFSKVVNKEQSNFNSKPADIIYLPSTFYVRLVNKRDTGNTLDKVFTVDGALTVDFLDIEPRKLEFYG